MTLPAHMHAVLLTGHGGFDRLQYRTDRAVPQPADNEVLIRVSAAGVNNTDINTRIGWYSKNVTEATGSGGDGFDLDVTGDGGWSGGLSFPRIQGADIAGTIVATGERVDPSRVGDRVIVRPIQNLDPDDPTACVTVGSEFDGGFAQFCAVRADQAFTVQTDLSDIELAALPCSYSTAEALLDRIGLSAGETVLVTGASGGVGSAAVQLAKLRGAHVVAQASVSKADAVAALGAHLVLDRAANLVSELGAESVDCVADLVAGPQWPSLLEVLRRQGRYGTSGAIAGPIVELDVRTLYLKDLTLAGSTFQPRRVFEHLVRYVEEGRLTPVVARTFVLADIVAAQEAFLDKKFVGKLVLIPPT